MNIHTLKKDCDIVKGSENLPTDVPNYFPLDNIKHRKQTMNFDGCLYKIQITPIANSKELTTIIFVTGIDENDRHFIEFSGAKYYKEQNNENA